MEEERITEDGSLSKLDRKVLERNRRLQMKEHFSKLASLITPTSRCNGKCSHVLVDEVIAYIKQLQERAERLKQRKQLLERVEEASAAGGSILPVVTVKDLGFIFEVCVVCGQHKNLSLYQVINVLVEEAAEVLSVSHSTVGGRIFYTIYFQAVCSRIGIEISRLHERLKELIL